MISNNSLFRQSLLWLRARAIHGTVPTINADCQPHAEDVFDAQLYAGCRSSLGRRFEFPLRVGSLIDRNTSCNQNRWNAECRELLMQIFFEFKENGTNLLLQHLNLVSPLGRQLLSQGDENSVETIAIPVRLAVGFDDVTNLEIGQDVQFKITRIDTARRRSVQRSVEPKTLDVTATRRVGAVQLITRQVLLTVDVNDEWTWSISSDASSYVQVANKTSRAESAGVVFEHVYVHCEYAPSGSSSARLRIQVNQEEDQTDTDTFDIDIHIFIKQAHVEVSLDRVSVALSQSQSSISRSIELRNSGNAQVDFSLSLLDENGEISSRFRAGVSGTGEVSGGLSEEGTTFIILTFSPAFLPATGSFTSFLLIRTDAWDGDESTIDHPTLPRLNASTAMNGTHLWVRIELIVTTVFVCSSDSALNKPGPLAHASMVTTVVNTDMADLSVISYNFTLMDLEHPGIEYKLKPRAWRNRAILSPWLQIRPWSLAIRSGTSSSLHVNFFYSNKDLPIWTEDGVLTSTSTDLELRFQLLIRLQGGVVSSASEADEVRTISQRVQLSPGHASPGTSVLALGTTVLFVGNRTLMVIDLRDIFDNTDASASFEYRDSENTPIDKTMPPVQLITSDYTESSVRIESPRIAQRGAMISGAIAFDIFAVALGSMTVDVQINGTSIQQSPVNITVVSVECDEHNEVADILGLQCLCRPGFYRSPGGCHPCPEGRISVSASNEESCTLCPEAYFSEGGSTQCHNCPSVGVTCSQGRLRLAPGTWCDPCASANNTGLHENTRAEIVRRLQNEELVFHKCRHRRACIVSNKTLFMTECAEGYKGPVCDTCRSGYAKDLHTHACVSCGNMLWNAIFALLIFAFIIVAITVVAIQSSKRVCKKTRSLDDKVDEGDEKDLLEATLVTFLDYLQIMALVESLQISPIGDTLSWIAQGSRVALFNPIQQTEVQCLTGFSVHTRSAFSMSLPGLLTVAVVLIQCAVYIFKFPRGFKFRALEAMLLPTVIRVLDFIHASTTATTMSVLTVYENPIQSSRRLSVDLSIEVGSAQYFTLYVIAIIALTVFVFGFPFAMVTFFLRKSWIARRTRRGIQKLQRQFSDVMSGLSAQRYGFLWPQILVIRKMILVFIGISATRPMDQLAMVTCVLLLSYGISVALRPYIDKRGNYIQFVCTVAAALTAGTGGLRYAVSNRADRSAIWMVDVTFLVIQFVVVVSVLVVIASLFPRTVRIVYAEFIQVLETVARSCRQCMLCTKRKLCCCKRRRLRRCHRRLNHSPMTIAPADQSSTSITDSTLLTGSMQVYLRRQKFWERQKQPLYHARSSRFYDESRRRRPHKQSPEELTPGSRQKLHNKRFKVHGSKSRKRTTEGPGRALSPASPPGVVETY